MDSNLTATIIGVAGTVLVGVAGFGAAVWNTRRTIAHAREDRVWDRKAEVYVDTLAAIQYRQVNRAKQLYPEDEQIRRQAEGIQATYKPPD